MVEARVTIQGVAYLRNNNNCTTAAKTKMERRQFNSLSPTFLCTNTSCTHAPIAAFRSKPRDQERVVSVFVDRVRSLLEENSNLGVLGRGERSSCLREGGSDACLGYVTKILDNIDCHGGGLYIIMSLDRLGQTCANQKDGKHGHVHKEIMHGADCEVGMRRTIAKSNKTCLKLLQSSDVGTVQIVGNHAENKEMQIHLKIQIVLEYRREKK